jgi:phage shock protein A
MEAGVTLMENVRERASNMDFVIQRLEDASEQLRLRLLDTEKKIETINAYNRQMTLDPKTKKKLDRDIDRKYET